MIIKKGTNRYHPFSLTQNIDPKTQEIIDKLERKGVNVIKLKKDPEI
ncbi:MAG: hypothetical protein ACFFAS_16270 [Promethearchaeota archaeon]